jgi:predicted  nucleic acid-binding Zn-ribbon protein
MKKNTTKRFVAPLLAAPIAFAAVAAPVVLTTTGCGNDVAYYQEQNETLRAQVAQLQTQITSLNADIAQREATIAAHVATIARLEAEIEDMTGGPDGVYGHLVRQLEAARAELADLAPANAAMRTLLDTIISEVNLLQVNHNLGTGNLTDATIAGAITGLATEINRLNGRIATLEAQVEYLMQQGGGGLPAQPDEDDIPAEDLVAAANEARTRVMDAISAVNTGITQGTDTDNLWAGQGARNAQLTITVENGNIFASGIATATGAPFNRPTAWGAINTINGAVNAATGVAIPEADRRGLTTQVFNSDDVLQTGVGQSGIVGIARYRVDAVQAGDWRFLNPQLQAMFTAASARLTQIEGNLAHLVSRADVYLNSYAANNVTTNVNTLLTQQAAAVAAGVTDPLHVTFQNDVRIARIEANRVRPAGVHTVIGMRFNDALVELAVMEAGIVNRQIAHAQAQLTEANRVIGGAGNANHEGGIWFQAWTETIAAVPPATAPTVVPHPTPTASTEQARIETARALLRPVITVLENMLCTDVPAAAAAANTTGYTGFIGMTNAQRTNVTNMLVNLDGTHRMVYEEGTSTAGDPSTYVREQLTDGALQRLDAMHRIAGLHPIARTQFTTAQNAITAFGGGTDFVLLTAARQAIATVTATVAELGIQRFPTPPDNAPTQGELDGLVATLNGQLFAITSLAVTGLENAIESATNTIGADERIVTAAGVVERAATLSQVNAELDILGGTQATAGQVIANWTGARGTADNALQTYGIGVAQTLPHEAVLASRIADLDRMVRALQTRQTELENERDAVLLIQQFIGDVIGLDATSTTAEIGAVAALRNEIDAILGYIDTAGANNSWRQQFLNYRNNTTTTTGNNGLAFFLTPQLQQMAQQEMIDTINVFELFNLDRLIADLLRTNEDGSPLTGDDLAAFNEARDILLSLEVFAYNRLAAFGAIANDTSGVESRMNRVSTALNTAEITQLQTGPRPNRPRAQTAEALRIPL